MDELSTQKSKPKNKPNESNKVETFYTNLKAEFLKITWPKREELTKQTVIVIILCAIIGAIIFGMDTGLGSVLQFVADLI